MPTSIKIKDIRIDGGTQSRTKLNERHLQHLLEVLEDDGRLEPIEVIYDGVDYWLWDGFHRVEVYRRAKRPTIPAHITQGTQRDAILKSCGANGKHGLPRCNADKRRAILRLLTDDEWGRWPDSQLARAAGVSREYVVRLRADLVAKGELSCDRSQDRQVIRSGTTFTMDTTKIGKIEPDATPISVPDTPAPQPATAPDWATILQPGKSYMINWVDHFVIDEPFNNHFEGKRAYPLKNHRPEHGVYIIAHPEIYNTYTLHRPASDDDSSTSALPTAPAPEGQPLHADSLDDSTSPDEPTTSALTIQPDKWYPVKHTDKVIYCDPFDKQADGSADPRYQGHAIQQGKIILVGIACHTVYASYQIVKPREQPRYDARQMSNAGEWTDGETAYLNRAQAVVNHAHPGKMPYVGSSELERLRARVAELEAENAELRSENTRLKAEVVNLRGLAQLPDVKEPPMERMH